MVSVQIVNYCACSRRLGLTLRKKKRRLGPKIKDDQLKTLAIADKLMTV